MRRYLSLFLSFVLIFTSLTCVCAFGDNSFIQEGFQIMINGEPTEYTSIIYNDTHYVPLRMVFEKTGSYVFYRSSDRQILILTRDGDMIRHIVGENKLTVNGEEKAFESPSLTESNIAFISVDMLLPSLCPDGILYENQNINIQKVFFESEYHKAVKDVLDMRWHSAFCAEKFQRYINYHRKNPAYGIHDVVYRVNIDLDYPFYDNITTIKDPYQLLVLVNKYHKLPENFSQYNLVNMERKYTINDGKQYLLAGVANEKYVEMAEAAKKDGMSLRVVSAYRTESYQRGLYNNKLRATGKTNADNYSARPGHSEHQTGLAVDINSTSGVFEYTKEFKWLKNHAHEYGFILRYPKGKEWITGYFYEPWHYRYVGEEIAKIIYEEGLTYEEFYAQYISAKEFK